MVNVYFVVWLGVGVGVIPHVLGGIDALVVVEDVVFVFVPVLVAADALLIVSRGQHLGQKEGSDLLAEV